jgi:peptide/nickel transport system permease protein
VTYAVRRVLAIVPVLFVLVTAVFFALRWIPGTPSATLAAGGSSGASAAQVSADEKQIRAALGLDRPLYVQYLQYLWRLAHLDLGTSVFGSNSVLGLLRHALPATIELTIAAMFLAVVIGTVTGLLAASHKDSALDAGIRGVATVSFSLPWFALGVLGLVVFGVQLHWLPTLGRLPSGLDYRPTTGFVLPDAVLQDRPELIGPWLEHLVLPASTLALSMAGYLTRIVRTCVLEVRNDDFVRTARMKGLTERAITQRHVLRNAALPVVTVLGLQFGSLLGGSVITETVFSYPGVGGLLVSAVRQRDYPIVQGAALAVAVLFTLANVVVDLLCLVLDPRLRTTSAP